MNLTALIATDAIPENAGWSPIQAALADRLSEVLSDLTANPEAFLKRALSVLVMNGDCRGLAFSTDRPDPRRHTDADTDSYILCRHLRSEILHTATLQPEMAGLASIGLMVVERITQSLNQLRGIDEWSDLFAPPHRKRNRLIHYQLEISEAPAYLLVAASLHHGACAKVSQLLTRPDGPFDTRLAGFLNWTIQIVRAIPANDVRETLSDYAPGEFDQIVKRTILRIGKHRTQIGHAYQPSSLRTLWSDWQALFYGTARERSFRDRSTYTVRLEQQLLDTADPERILSDNEEIERFLQADQRLEQLERDELEPDRSRAVHGATPRSRAFSLDDGHACLAANPSTCMPGVLPRVILAMVYEGLVHLPTDWSGLNDSCACLLISSMLHLGRRPEWLLNLRLGSKPGNPEACANPIFDPAREAIYYKPEQYLGLPSLLVPQADINAETRLIHTGAWRNHDLALESINLVHEIILPSSLANTTRTYLEHRKQSICEQPLMAASLIAQADGGPFFLWMRDGVLSTLTEADVACILGFLTDFIRGYVSEYPPLRPTNFTRSFDAYYTANGMRAEYRYSVSERGRYWLQMPLRYSRFGSDHIHSIHNAACSLIESQIREERARYNFDDPIQFD